ncbi:hypothetical protein DENSPDRAFT_881632 [Dentipellis sp. KUC8613]|nr:hypothetical protein DENSPDRAFT_881632 [Dentipellis sp. KUC8613]
MSAIAFSDSAVAKFRAFSDLIGSQRYKPQSSVIPAGYVEYCLTYQNDPARKVHFVPGLATVEVFVAGQKMHVLAPASGGGTIPVGAEAQAVPSGPADVEESAGGVTANEGATAETGWSAGPKGQPKPGKNTRRGKNLGNRAIELILGQQELGLKRGKLQYFSLAEPGTGKGTFKNKSVVFNDVKCRGKPAEGPTAKAAPASVATSTVPPPNAFVVNSREAIAKATSAEGTVLGIAEALAATAGKTLGGGVVGGGGEAEAGGPACGIADVTAAVIDEDEEMTDKDAEGEIEPAVAA